MQLLKLKLKNFMSYENAEIDFSGMIGKFVLIKGKINNSYDDRFSNGAGKSSLIHALLFGLFGEVFKDRTDMVDYISKFSDKKESEIELQLFDEYTKNIYTIRRKLKMTKKGGASTTYALLKNDQPLVFQQKRFFNEFIYDLIGKDKTTFLLTQIFSTELNKLTSFVHMSNSEKLKIIENLLKIDVLNKFGNFLSKVEKWYSNELSRLSSLYENEQSHLEELEKTYEAAKEVLQDYEKRIAEKVQKGKELEQKLQNLLDQIKAYPKPTLISEVPLQKDIEHLRDVESNLSSIILKYNADIKEMENLMKKKVCPTCKRPFTDNDIVEYRTMINEIKEKKRVYETKHENIRKKLSDLTKEFDRIIKANYRDKMLYEQKITELKKEYGMVKHQFDQIKIEIEELQKEYKKYKKSLNAEELINQTKKKLEDIKNKINEYETKLKAAKFWSSLISPKSAVRFKLFSTFFESVSMLSTQILSVFYPDTDVRLELEYDNKKSQLQTYFYKNNILYTFNQLSQGERRKFEIAFNLAVMEYFYSLSPKFLNILVFDEFIDGLDTPSIDIFIRLLKDFVRKYNITTLFITHHHIDSGYFDKVITIEKVGDKSYVLI